jgi:hypothetical protein
VFAGIVTVRITPTPATEAAALWGFAAGAATGALAGLAAAFAGGPLGDGRLARVGPSGWQVGLVAVLEIGVTAALTAAAANWLTFRRQIPRNSPAPDTEPSYGPAELAGIRFGVIDENDDADGHRIYLNPWADEEEGPDKDEDPDEEEGPDKDEDPDEEELPAVLQDAELVADRVAELGAAHLLGRHRIRAVHAVVVRIQLRPEHRQYQQPQRAERQAEPAEYDPAGRPARPGRATAPRLAVDHDAEPDRDHGEQQGQDGHEHAAAHVAQPEGQAEQAEHAQRERRQGLLARGRVWRWQLPGWQHPRWLGSALARWLISGHRHLFCPVRRAPDPCLRVAA